MKRVKLGLFRLDERAKMPQIAHVGDAGIDIYALEDVDIYPGETKLIPTGWALEIPHGWEVQVRPTSGNALKTGTLLPNSPGTIDAGYKGDCGVMMRNAREADIQLEFDTTGNFVGTKPIKIEDAVVHIKAGQKIAQWCVREIPIVDMFEVPRQTTSDRGTAGFGSTGGFDAAAKLENASGQGVVVGEANTESVADQIKAHVKVNVETTVKKNTPPTLPKNAIGGKK